MLSLLTYKTKQLFFAVIKLSIVVVASYFIYNKLANNNNLDFSVFASFLMKSGLFLMKNIIFMILLTFFA